MNICAIATDHLRSFHFTAGLQRTASLVRTMSQGHLGVSAAGSENADVIDGVSVNTPGSATGHLTDPYAGTSSPPPLRAAPYGSVEPDAADAHELAERVGAPPVDEPGADQERGVVRLLEEGHFKGVADVRLRLNFFDRLNHESLPELRPPNGNGRAYDRFMQMYAERRGDDGGGGAVDEIA